MQKFTGKIELSGIDRDTASEMTTGTKLTKKSMQSMFKGAGGSRSSSPDKEGPSAAREDEEDVDSKVGQGDRDELEEQME